MGSSFGKRRKGHPGPQIETVLKPISISPGLHARTAAYIQNCENEIPGICGIIYHPCLKPF